MFLFFFIVASLIVGSIGLALNMDVVNGVMRGMTFFGSELRVPAFSVKQWVESFQSGLAMFVGTFGLFLALMATSTLFPLMLQKGSIDLLLCHPIPRWRLITARFAGGDHGLQCRISVSGRLDGFGSEIVGLESWIPGIDDIGHLRLRRAVFRSHDRFRNNRERTGGFTGGDNASGIQPGTGGARTDYARFFLGTISPHFSYIVLGSAEIR